jgi:hypothetical protein
MMTSGRNTRDRVEKFPAPDGQISCQYTHLLKGFDLKDISKSQIETVDFLLKCMSREEWNINFYRL